MHKGTLERRGELLIADNEGKAVLKYKLVAVLITSC